MLRRRARSLSPERVYGLEEPLVSWRNVSRQLLTLEDNVAKVQARLRRFDGLIALHKAQLVGDEESLSVARVARIAKQFRADTREYTTALEEVLDVLERGNLALWTALHQEEGGEPVLANSDDELRVRRRARLSRLLVDHWLSYCRQEAAGAAPRRPPSSLESSSSHSDLGCAITPKKKHRRPWFGPPKREVPSDWTSEKEDADEESGGVTEDLGLEGRGVLDSPASSNEEGVLAALFGRLFVRRSSSGDAGAAASGGSDAREWPEDRWWSPDRADATLYRSAVSSSCQSFHSATSGDEADCEPETTPPAVSTSTESSTGNGNGGGSRIPSGRTEANSNASDDGNGNGRVSRHSTGSHTDESWVPRDRIELAGFDRQSPWGAMHELCRQQGLLRLQLQQHAQRLEALRLARLHLLSRAHPLRASRLLRAQLRDALRTVASEVHATQHCLHLRACTLRFFTRHVWHTPPQ